MSNRTWNEMQIFINSEHAALRFLIVKCNAEVKITLGKELILIYISLDSAEITQEEM